MAGNSIGQHFRVTTFGESHGIALGCIVDGCPPGLEITEADLQTDLDRRRPGTSRYTTQRREPDEVKILSGVFEGKTTGTSIGLLIENTDQRSKDYSDIKDKFRPGHADYTYHQKYGIRDYRGGGRSSARETAMRVAAGAIAKKYLKDEFGVEIRAYLSQMGDVSIDKVDWDEIENNAFFCPDADKVEAFDQLIRDLKKEGDSIGAKIQVVATNVPVGLGEPVFDRLDADIAHALMSINAVKGVEIGDGFDVVNQKAVSTVTHFLHKVLVATMLVASLVVSRQVKTSLRILHLSQHQASRFRVTLSLKKVNPLSSSRKVVTTHVSAFVLYLLLKPCWRLL